MEENDGNISSLEEARQKKEQESSIDFEYDYTEQEQLVDMFIGVLENLTDIYAGEKDGIEVEGGEVMPIVPEGAYVLLCGTDGEYINFSSNISKKTILDMIKILTQSLELELDDV